MSPCYAPRLDQRRGNRIPRGRAGQRRPIGRRRGLGPGGTLREQLRERLDVIGVAAGKPAVGVGVQVRQLREFLTRRAGTPSKIDTNTSRARTAARSKCVSG